MQVLYDLLHDLLHDLHRRLLGGGSCSRARTWPSTRSRTFTKHWARPCCCTRATASSPASTVEPLAHA